MDAEVTENATDQGFTLIELLVSVAILSVLAVGASLALSRQTAPQDRDMAVFQTLFDTQRDQAIHSGQPRGLLLSTTSFVSAGLQSNGWQTDTKERDWSGRVSLSAKLRPAQTPDIVLLPSGMVTPFRISFGGQNQCDHDGLTGLRCSEH